MALASPDQSDRSTETSSTCMLIVVCRWPADGQ
jgi:hypothetical protein